MKTAEEILKSKINRDSMLLNEPSFTFNKVIEAMTEYAKMHVEAQTQKIIDELPDTLSIGVFNTIRNAYDLNQIK
jgi:hypothetical protein